MDQVLNVNQLKGLADFYFDAAKGVVLGSAGFTAGDAGISLTTRLVYLFVGGMLTYFCLQVALNLLEETA